MSESVLGGNFFLYYKFVSVNLIWRISSITCTISLVEVEQVLGKEDTVIRDETVGKANAKSD
jgi:hypothetical protein